MRYRIYPFRDMPHVLLQRYVQTSHWVILQHEFYPAALVHYWKAPVNGGNAIKVLDGLSGYSNLAVAEEAR